MRDPRTLIGAEDEFDSTGESIAQAAGASVGLAASRSAGERD